MIEVSPYTFKIYGVNSDVNITYDANGLVDVTDVGAETDIVTLTLYGMQLFPQTNLEGDEAVAAGNYLVNRILARKSYELITSVYSGEDYTTLLTNIASLIPKKKKYLEVVTWYLQGADQADLITAGKAIPITIMGDVGYEPVGKGKQLTFALKKSTLN